MVRFTKANQRGNEQAIQDLREADKALRQGRGATPTNIHHEKRRIYEHLHRQGIPIDDVLFNNRRIHDKRRGQ